MITTQVFFSGYGRWGFPSWCDETETCEWVYVSKNSHNMGLFSLTILDNFRHKYTKTLEELNIRRLEPSEDIIDCAFLKQPFGKKYPREVVVFEVDTSSKYLLEEVRNSSVSKNKKESKKPSSIIDITQINNKTVLNIEEVAILTSLTLGYIYKLTSLQKIPHSKLPGGKKLYFKRSEIEDWMQKHRINTIDSIFESANQHINNFKK